MNQATHLKQLTWRKSYEREVVRGVSIEMSGGEIIGLLGPNGAGKTTTFSMIAGFVHLPMERLMINGMKTSFRRTRGRDRTSLFARRNPLYLEN